MAYFRKRDNEIVLVEVELPGVSSSDVTIDIENNILIISGDKKAKKMPENG